MLTGFLQGGRLLTLGMRPPNIHPIHCHLGSVDCSSKLFISAVLQRCSYSSAAGIISFPKVSNSVISSTLGMLKMESVKLFQKAASTAPTGGPFKLQTE